MKRMAFGIVYMLILGLLNACAPSIQQKRDSLPSTIYKNQRDYSFMWWKKSIKTGNEVFAIKTNNYALSFDYPNLSIQNFDINKRVQTSHEVARETNVESFPKMDPVGFRFGTFANETPTWCSMSSGDVDDCQLVETGKYFQRRFINSLPELEGFDSYKSGLEIASWPDRVSFILRGKPLEKMYNAGLIMSLEFHKKYNELLEQGNVMALRNPADDSGFVILKSKKSTEISVSGTKVTTTIYNTDGFEPGKEVNTGMVIYPVPNDIGVRFKEIVAGERNPLRISAKQILPLEQSLNISYEPDLGWHQIALRTDAIESNAPVVERRENNPGPRSNDLNNRMERVVFTVENTSEIERPLRINFAKGRLVENGSKVFAIPGISAVLRDTLGNPIGVPIQLSKNWHTGRDKNNQYFQGTWYHGLSMLTIPAKSTLTLEYTSVNGLWGGVPAASHAQLCLVGWGSNQQWDESAIGAWGESITYEPDLDQASAPVLDFRPLMVRSKSGKEWGWTSNLGGADFFNYTKTDGNRAWHSRMRTQYKRYSPNFTEVTYSGIMDDNSMDFEYTASIGRSDDMIRGIYKIKLNVLKDTDFEDFVIFQVGASTYHFTNSKTLAWGNEKGLQNEWKATTGGASRYISDQQLAEGVAPWFSFTDSDFSVDRAKFIPANRGFVIREWNAKINGHENTPPYFAEYNTISGNHGGASSLINIKLPKGCKSLKKGDFIEAEIVLFIIPAKAEDYYGPNANFATALANKANSWKMVHREAISNNLEVNVDKGKLLDAYPIRIEASNNKASFTATGGLGYVPLIISNVGKYRNPELFEKLNDEWKKVDQSVHGNDFWQSEYNTKTSTWDISYNLDMDTPHDERITREFKFVGH